MCRLDNEGRRHRSPMILHRPYTGRWGWLLIAPDNTTDPNLKAEYDYEVWERVTTAGLKLPLPGAVFVHSWESN